MINQAASKVLLISATTYGWAASSKELPTTNADAWIGRWPQIPNLRVVWHTRARWETLFHCFETPEVEVGGVLLGNIYQAGLNNSGDQTLYFIEITGSIAARSKDSGPGHIEFSPETWAEILNIRDRDFRGDQIVGWYHTHPGHEVFLSGHDLFIQNHFFAEKGHLALVIETYKHYGAFFIGSEKQGGPYRSQDFSWDHKLFRAIAQDRSEALTPDFSDSHANRAETTLSIENDREHISVSVDETEISIDEVDLGSDAPGQEAPTGDLNLRFQIFFNVVTTLNIIFSVFILMILALNIRGPNLGVYIFASLALLGSTLYLIWPFLLDLVVPTTE